MEKLSKEEIRKFIINFLSDMHDYIPNVEIDESNIIGCFNTYYHGEIGQSLFYPPIKMNSDISIVTSAVVYLLTEDENILLMTKEGEVYNLDDCIGKSYEMVFKKIRIAYRAKIKNE